MDQAHWYATIIAAAVTGIVGWLAKEWASRGQRQMDKTEQLSDMAMTMIDKLEKRMNQYEAIQQWNVVVHAMKDDHILVLRDLIMRQVPPPPPERPVYPPMPSFPQGGAS